MRQRFRIFTTVVVLCLAAMSMSGCSSRRVSLDALGERMRGYLGPPEIRLKVYPQSIIAGPGNRVPIKADVRIEPHELNRAVQIKFMEDVSFELLITSSYQQIDGEQHSEQLKPVTAELFAGKYRVEAVLERADGKKFSTGPQMVTIY